MHGRWRLMDGYSQMVPDAWFGEDYQLNRMTCILQKVPHSPRVAHNMMWMWRLGEDARRRWWMTVDVWLWSNGSRRMIWRRLRVEWNEKPESTWGDELYEVKNMNYTVWTLKWSISPVIMDYFFVNNCEVKFVLYLSVSYFAFLEEFYRNSAVPPPMWLGVVCEFVNILRLVLVLC